MPPIKRRRSEEEHIEQVKFVKWFRLRFRDTRILAIPNGGNRNPIVAAKLKAEGVSPGVPDLFVPAWRLWIEMKRRKSGRTSPSQLDWIAYLRSIGHQVYVANGWSEAREAIRGVVPVRTVAVPDGLVPSLDALTARAASRLGVTHKEARRAVEQSVLRRGIEEMERGAA